MTLVIKGGTVVTADLTFPADVLIDGGVITAIGKDLKGDKVIDATGCYLMPGGIDPHTHLEMPFMGTQSADDFSTGTSCTCASDADSKITHPAKRADQPCSIWMKPIR